MAVTMYQATVPAALRMLTSLSAILDKMVAHCEAKKIDPAVLLTYRLAPDMFNFTRQVQVVTDQAKGLPARLAGIEVPAYPDTETTVGELKARIAKTIDFIKSIPAERVDGSEEKEIVLKLRADFELKFSGLNYAFGFVLPNLYFHATTAYDILRHAGVPLEKRDFLGGI